MRAYAIGDIHGQFDLLRRAHNLISRDGGAGAPVVHLGDLIDRGPDSRGVVDYLMAGQAAGRPWIAVRGNHDPKLAMFLREPLWLDPGAAEPQIYTAKGAHGAAETLASYGVELAEDRPLAEVHAEALALVPGDHADWLERLPLWYRFGDALFVHAGLRPGVALEAQDALDLMWIRKEFHNDGRDHGFLVVHGHTPIREATHYGNRVNMDSGAGQGGPLSVARIDGEGVWLMGDDGARRLGGR
ncbi:MAG: metallophosphoesterase family protein [Paracoccus sp. (in: a-proteobacteria)]|nr:metallophosphoesterase family protein [Paracoccus sp. (in: a-proteobacteria)]